MNTRIIGGVFAALSFFPLFAADLRNVDSNYLNDFILKGYVSNGVPMPRFVENYTLPEVIEALRALDDKYAGPHASLLIRLKDERTIEKYTSAFVASNGANRQSFRVLTESHSPWVIPLIVGVMLDGGPAKAQLRETDTLGFGASGDTYRVISNILFTSPEVPSAVKEWIKGNRTGRTDDELNQAIGRFCAWWIKNRGHFYNERYDLLKIPDITASASLSDSTQPVPEPLPFSVADQPMPEAIQSPIAAAIPTPTIKILPAKEINLVWWIVCLIILAAGMVFLARKKNPKS